MALAISSRDGGGTSSSAPMLSLLFLLCCCCGGCQPLLHLLHSGVLRSSTSTFRSPLARLSGDFLPHFRSKPALCLLQSPLEQACVPTGKAAPTAVRLTIENGTAWPGRAGFADSSVVCTSPRSDGFHAVACGRALHSSRIVLVRSPFSLYVVSGRSCVRLQCWWLVPPYASGLRRALRRCY